jgi:hypothetical protein
MRRLRTLSTRRLQAVVAIVAALAVTGGIAQAALNNADPKPRPMALDRAVTAALRAPDVAGITARVKFTNSLLPSGALPRGSASPLAAGADGRVWLADDGRFRIELQSGGGDAQIVSDGKRVSIYDAASNTVYVADVPEDRHAKHEQRREPATPAGVQKALRSLSGFWSVSGARPTSTAGRPTYTVRIAPKDDGGLLGAAELAWDAARGVPLRAAVYAQGRPEPVLELEATEVSYGRVPAADLKAAPPAGAKVVEIDPKTKDQKGRETRVRGVEDVQRHLDFRLAAPAELAGLPRREVRLVRLQDGPGAVSVYGKGLGAIAVFQHKASRETRKGPNAGDVRLPQINIGGATGTELATALGTVVTFERDGVAYVVAGSVPPVAAESAARGLG